ncbi:MAG: trans-sulfuration enzyme family protein [Anaerovoracaceae bacterium]|jgi:cystathionine beta-lyase
MTERYNPRVTTMEDGLAAGRALEQKHAEQVFDTVEDILAHKGDFYDEFRGAIAPPIYQTSLYVWPTATNNVEDHPYVWTRLGNPTQNLAEEKIAALEGAEAAIVTASGMGAISAGILHFIENGCHVVMVASSYGPAYQYITKYLAKKCGVTVTLVTGTCLDEIEAAIRPETTLIYLESPSSTVFRLQDIGEVAKIAKSRGIGTVIDSTYATPLHCNPIKHGIDISVHTASKYLAGHSDVVAGAIACSREIADSIRSNELAMHGACLDPFAAWLLVRGMRTLKVRLDQHGANAMKIARYLENSPKIKKVFYPGLESDPQYDLFKKYFTGTNGLISFIPNGTDHQITDFFMSLRMFQYGCSWGGYESLVIPETVGMTDEEAAARDLETGIVRIHVGIEHVDTLIADLEQALQHIPEIA